MSRSSVLCILFIVVSTGLAFAQDAGISLRRGFRDILLGSDFDTTEQTIIGDSAFAYRGRPDVSLSLSNGERTIDTQGRFFVDRGLFVFHDDRLYSISLYLEQQRLDYFQLFRQLSERYGDPNQLDPDRAIWEDENTRITLERPLTVQYLDLETFRSRRDATRNERAIEDLTREEFLDEF